MKIIRESTVVSLIRPPAKVYVTTTAGGDCVHSEISEFNFINAGVLSYAWKCRTCGETIKPTQLSFHKSEGYIV